jgi:hypothetical protein
MEEVEVELVCKAVHYFKTGSGDAISSVIFARLLPANQPFPFLN